jgi:hypothetical protein
MKTIEIPKDHVFTAVSVNGKISKSLKPIKIDNFWVVIDTKANIKSSDLILNKTDNSICNIQLLPNTNLKKLKKYNKIIASTKFIDKCLPIIKFIEYTVEELATNHVEKNKNNFETWKEKEHTRIGFIAGNNAAKSSDKKYTEKDLRKAIKLARQIKDSKEIFDLEDITR